MVTFNNLNNRSRFILLLWKVIEVENKNDIVRVYKKIPQKSNTEYHKAA